ncbi:MAG: hypothetical protein WED07_09690 [Candidatus Freyarchaeum deiterrae]
MGSIHMAYLLLVFLLIVLFVYLGLHMAKLEPYRPKILVPLIFVSVLIVVASIVIQEPWWANYVSAIKSILPFPF